jgi:predicted MFS family arabinose efflux permease
LTDRHWNLVGFATLWLLLLFGIWIDWRWSLTIVALLSLLGLVRRASQLPPSPRSPDRKP